MQTVIKAATMARFMIDPGKYILISRIIWKATNHSEVAGT
jgi:hypothetical protein